MSYLQSSVAEFSLTGQLARELRQRYPVGDPDLKRDLMASVVHRLPKAKRPSTRRLNNLALAIILTISAVAMLPLFSC
jgi:hypothetical protein